MQEVERRMDLNMEVLIPRSPPMGESDSVAEAARTELSSLEIITPAADKKSDMSSNDSYRACINILG